MRNPKFMIWIVLILLIRVTLEATYHKISHYDELLHSNKRLITQIDSTLIITVFNQIHSIDISNPEQPEFIQYFSVTEPCNDIKVIDNFAYIANDEDGLLILDVSNPQSPLVIGSCDTPDCAKKLDVSGNFVYIADFYAGLQIIDVTDPYNPVIASSFVSDYRVDIAVSDTLVFLADYYGNIQVFDVSDPYSPILICEHFDTPDYINDIVVLDSVAYIVDFWGLYIYDVSDPTDFDLLGIFEVPFGYEILISQNIAYLSAEYSGFYVLDISDLSNPEMISQLKTPVSATAFAISDDITYILDYNTGLEIYDISEPENPDIVGFVDTAYDARSLDIFDNLAYIAGSYAGLQILDISDPYSPYIINFLGSSVCVRDFIKVGTWGYACTNTGLYVYNLEDPISPVIISIIDISGLTLTYSNDHLYVACLGNGVKIINVEDPFSPYLVSECYIGGNSYDLVVSGNYIYVATTTSGMKIIDATDLSNPILLNYLCDEINVYFLTKKDNILYLSGNFDGLIVMDVSNSVSPVQLQRITSRPDSRFKARPIVIDDLLIAEDLHWNELLFFDITDPANPDLISTYIWNLSTRDFGVYEDYLVTANSYNGVSILDMESITSIENNILPSSNFALSNYPNPFNPTTTISFSIPKQSNIELQIFNIKGQKVKILINEKKDSGHYQVVWDGRDENDQLVGSGIYFYKLNINGKTEAVKKCLLLK